MRPSKESADELLAQWADLLRSRDGLAFATTFLVRYQTSLTGEQQEYYCRDDWKIRDGLLNLFREDVDHEIADVEEALRKLGIVITRPPRPDRQPE